MLNSLRTRLTLIFVGLTIIPLAIVGSLIAARGSSVLQNRSVEFQSEVAERTALSIEGYFNEIESELLALTEIYGFDTLPTSQQQDILLTLLSRRTAYYQLTLVDADAQEVIRLTRGEVVTTNNLTSHTDDALFHLSVENRQVSLGDVYFNEDARDRLVTIAVPIEDLFTGSVSYVLIADVRFQNVGDTILRELELEEGDDVYVTNTDGVIIAHTNPNFVIKETTFDLPEEDGRTTGLSGGDVVLAIQPAHMANQQFIVVAETSYANATRLADDLTNIAMVITFSTLIVSSIIVIVIVSRVVNPIINMAYVAKKVQEGDLSAKADEKGSDEIAVLGHAFNDMTTKLKDTLAGLQNNVEKLEVSNKERGQLIRDLQAAKRIADENSRLKSEFLATMSHELRTPMNAIEGFTSIMLKRMAGVDYNEKAERYLYKVQSNSQRLLGLINDFLDLSRIESGRMQLAYLPMSPQEMAHKWKESMGVLAENKGLQFNLTVDPELPETIYGNEEALSKIAINLIGNAAKFTKEGSVSLDLRKQNDEMVLEVKDTGIGIPPHARDFIFEEFRQVDQSSKREFGGTGLGLAIVQKLVREMGGSISLDSEVGVGSTFTVLVPINTNEQQQSEMKHAANS